MNNDRPQGIKRRRVVVLGATGSIGESTIRVARALPEQIEIVGLSGRNNFARLLELAGDFPSASLCAGDAAAASS
ncbi:MAG: 1-deoxy-D-xylulose-5-phosphate reductoisomerase, partial [bacterium]